MEREALTFHVIKNDFGAYNVTAVNDDTFALQGCLFRHELLILVDVITDTLRKEKS